MDNSPDFVVRHFKSEADFLQPPPFQPGRQPSRGGIVPYELWLMAQICQAIEADQK